MKGLLLLLALGASAVGPVPRASIVSYISHEDYPADAARAGVEGLVQLRLDVSADGRVTGCTVTESSSSSLLDSTSCRLLVRRARFDPARDEAGRPTTGSYETRINWKAPKGPRAPRLDALTAIWSSCVYGEASKLILTPIPAERIPDEAFSRCSAIEGSMATEMQASGLPGMVPADTIDALKQERRSAILTNASSFRRMLATPSRPPL